MGRPCFRLGCSRAGKGRRAPGTDRLDVGLGWIADVRLLASGNELARFQSRSVIAAINDIGSELLFFCLFSLAACHAYYATTVWLWRKLSPANFRWISALLNTAMGALLIGQVLVFAHTSLAAVEVRHVDDRNRFVYFWVIGVAFGFAGSYPLYRKRLVAMGRGFLPQGRSPR